MNNSLSTAYNGAKIILWPGGMLSTSTDWYGLGMNSYTMLYNQPVLNFQTNDIEYACINSTGINVSGNVTTITCEIVDTTGNLLVIGTGSNKWLLINTYTSASLL